MAGSPIISYIRIWNAWSLLLLPDPLEATMTLTFGTPSAEIREIWVYTSYGLDEPFEMMFFVGLTPLIALNEEEFLSVFGIVKESCERLGCRSRALYFREYEIYRDTRRRRAFGSMIHEIYCCIEKVGGQERLCHRVIDPETYATEDRPSVLVRSDWTLLKRYLARREIQGKEHYVKRFFNPLILDMKRLEETWRSRYVL